MMRIKPSKHLKELRLLYVEDDKAVQEAFLELVQRYFKEVFVANNGEEGLQLFERHRVDIVISDIRMPRMDGLTMVEKIKELDPQVFVLLLTAFSDNEYLMKALELGVEGYLVKPIDRNKLFKKLNLFAEMIYAQKEQRNVTKLLRFLFDRYEDAIALFEEDTLRIANKKFLEVFGDIKTLKDFEEKISDSLQEHQIVQLSSSQYFELSVEKVGIFTIIILQDITYLQNELFVDELTKAYNRKYFELLQEKLLGKKICMLFFDIDNFKKINDTFGHDVGDMVLRKLTEVIKQNLRSQDTLIRWGGEEFMILLDGVKNPETAQRIGWSLVHKVAQTPFEKVGHITISMGAGCGEIQNKEEYEHFFKALDEALYRAKKSGKNRLESIIK